MYIAVSISGRVWRTLETITAAERDAFVAALEIVRTAPIKKSEPTHNPKLSEYALRFFRFGTKQRWLAVFEYDMAAGRIRVIECRLLPQRRKPRSDRGSGPRTSE